MNSNLLIDDFNPQVTPDSKDWKALNKLMDEFPDLKVTLFAVADMREVIDRDEVVLKSRYSFMDHPEWIKWVKSFGDRIEVAMHGLYHWDYRSNTCNEFARFDYQGAIDRLRIMLSIFKLIPKATMGFRFPGHKFNNDVCRALFAMNFKYISIPLPNAIYQYPYTIIESGTDLMLSGHFGLKHCNGIHNNIDDLRMMIRKQEDTKRVRLIDLCEHNY